MRIVLDTNVYISAIIIGGLREKVLKETRKKKIEVLICLDILEEISRVLKEKFNWQNWKIQIVIDDIFQKTILIKPKTKIPLIKEKKADNKILECALEGKAHFIISGDKKHILPLKEFKGIKILNPKYFLKLIQKI